MAKYDFFSYHLKKFINFINKKVCERVGMYLSQSNRIVLDKNFHPHRVNLALGYFYHKKTFLIKVKGGLSIQWLSGTHLDAFFAHTDTIYPGTTNVFPLNNIVEFNVILVIDG